MALAEAVYVYDSLWICVAVCAQAALPTLHEVANEQTARLLL